MVRDRILEFQQRSQEEAMELGDTGTSPDELNASRLVQRSQQFLSHIDELRLSVDQLRQRIETLQQRQTAVLSQTVVRPEHKAQLSALIDEIQQHTRSLRPRVREIENDLRRDEATSALRSSAELRIRRNQCEMLKLRLNDLLSIFNQTQDEYKSRVSKRVKRQLELLGQHVTGAQVDKMLDSKSQEVFYRQLQPTSHAVQSALDDATTRHNEILEIEQSIIELHDIFRDVHDIVHSQSFIVDNIATNVEAAGEYVQDAQVQVTHALTYKKSAGRRKFMLIIITVVLFAILITIAIIILLAKLPSRA